MDHTTAISLLLSLAFTASAILYPTAREWRDKRQRKQRKDSESIDMEGMGELDDTISKVDAAAADFDSGSSDFGDLGDG